MMPLRISLSLIAIACFALHSVPDASARYVDLHKNHAEMFKDEEGKPEQPIKAPPAPPIPVEGKVKYKPKTLVEVPFHLSPYEAMREAEMSEGQVLKAVKKTEDKYPNAIYMITFYIPQLRTGPMQLPRDPNIYISNIMNEIRELKIPRTRLHSTIQYIGTLRAPRIIVYCYQC